MRNVLRLLISLITIYSSMLFPSGVFYSVLNNEGTTWTQILTFTVKQVVRVEWSYDELTPVPIDPESSLGTVGLVSITSNKKFKFFVNALVEDSSIQEAIVPRKLIIGSNSIDPNQTVHVHSKKLDGLLALMFEINWEQLSKQDFQVRLEFTFLPF